MLLRTLVGDVKLIQSLLNKLFLRVQVYYGHVATRHID